MDNRPTLLFSLVVGLACAGPLAAQRGIPADPPHHLVEVYVKDARTLDALVAMDLDLAACSAIELPAKTVDVVATDADIERLRQAGLDFEVAIRNLEDHYERELAKDVGQTPFTLTPPLGKGAMGGHYTLKQVEAILDSFVRDHPKICAKWSIGKSVEGRDIQVVKISDNVHVDENEPEVLYDALHHAREPLSMETTLLFMDELLTQYGKQAEATFIVNERELFFIPVMNPDGYEYNRRIRPNGGGLWRKNRRGGYGVDLNRNYKTGFGGPGSSGNRYSSVYRGPSAFSEPETAAHEAFTKTRAFYHVFSSHTYTEVLLRPWGYQRGHPPNRADYDRLGARLTAQNHMRYGAASILLYLASGTTLDHAHAAHGAFGWTPEIGKRSEGGFWPRASLIPVIARRQQHMFRQVALSAENNARAAYDTFGAACAGSRGKPVLSAAGVPRLGTTFSVQLSGAVSGARAVLFFGGSDRTWSGVRLPFDLGAFGAPGCVILASGEVQIDARTSASGTAGVPVAVPNITSLKGVRFYNQWIVTDPAANRAGLATSNGGVGTVGR